MSSTWFNYHQVMSSDTSASLGITLPTQPFVAAWGDTTSWYQGKIYMGYPLRGTSTQTSNASFHPFGFPNTTTVSGTSMATLVSATGVPAAVKSYLVAQFISDTLEASSFTTTGSNSFLTEVTVYAKLNTAATSCSLQYAYAIVNAAGTSLYFTSGSSSSLTTTLTAYTFTGSLSPATITIPSGARVILELAFQSTSATQSPNVLIRTGSPASTNLATAGDTTGNLACWCRCAVGITTTPATQMNVKYNFFDPKTTVTATSGYGPTKTSKTFPVTAAISAVATTATQKGILAIATVATTATAVTAALHLMTVSATCNITAVLIDAFYIMGTYRVAVEKIYRNITTVIYSKISGKNDGES